VVSNRSRPARVAQRFVPAICLLTATGCLLAATACPLAATGCLPARPVTRAEAEPASSAAAHGPGIAVDFPTVPPSARNAASAADRVVALQTPLGVEAATTALKAFFRSVLEENATALGVVVTADAVVQDLPEAGTVRAGQPTRSREALNFWAQRFRQRDYGRLAAELVFRESDVELFRAGLLERLPSLLGAVAAEKLDGMAETDLLLRVPILTGAVRSEQLFGKEIYLWLRRAGDRYVIYHLAEPFPF